MDVLGPIRKHSSAQPFYVLSLVDTYSRWPEITVLRSLTSKAIVNALLATFARTSIPDVLLCDNAGDLVGGLNKAVYTVLGIKLQNSMPYHPQSNGICERFNSVLKKMIHLAMNEGSGREWQKKLDILLWGYREAEHAVLGVSPYQMLYGHVGKGPLNTVKNCWTKEIDQQIENKSVKDYMSDLKQDLEIGARVAEENCTVRQRKYINKYNEKTQDKFFEVGESVLVLMKDVSNKILAKWVGPLIITDKLAKNNYRVANKDGTTRKLHADDLRKWTARTASSGIVYERKDEFGDRETCPTKADRTDSEQEINNLDLSYLSDSRNKQKKELILNDKLCGERTSQSTHNRVMQIILNDHSKYSGAYVDDVAVFSMKWREHLEHFENVLKSFQKAGMTLKLKKCSFGKDKVRFLGHLVGRGSHRPIVDKVEAIMKLQPPTTKKGLRSFIGMINFYKHYIKDASSLLKPLTDMTSKKYGNRIQFGEDQTKAFDKVKQALADCTDLFAPQYDKPFILRTDASDTCVAGVLSQEGEEGEYPIVFLSSKLTGPMLRYSILEKECWATIYCLKKVEHIIWGSKTHLYVDNNPLYFSMNSKPSSSKLTRWG